MLKNSLHRWFAVGILLGCVFLSMAQNYIMPSSGSQTITACSGYLLDPGGTSTYPNSCDSYITINPSTPGCKVNISGSYETENNYDYFYVYDGTSTSGQQLGNFTGSGSCDVTSTSGSLTIHFHSDPSVTRDGFNLTVNCVGGCSCGGPYGLTTSVGSGSATVSWANPNSSDISGYILEYGIHGFTPGNGTVVYTTSNTYSLPGLSNGTQYDVYVWYDCGDDHVVTTETPTMVSFTPSSNVIMPVTGNVSVTLCSGHIYDSGGPSDSYSNSESGSVTIYSENPWCQIHLSGSYNTENNYDRICLYDAGGSGTLLDQYTGTGSINYTSPGNAITISFTSDNTVTKSGFDITVSCTGQCVCGSLPITGLHAVPIDPDGLQLIWNEALGDTSIHQYIIEYGLEGFTPGTGTLLYSSVGHYDLMGLNAGSTYTFYVWADCNNDGLVTTESAAVLNYCMPNSSFCLDFTDLTIPQITCTSGQTNQGGPYSNVGVVNYGSASPNSQHTVNFLSEKDPRTGNLLSTIPPCELYSVRLGNWMSSYGCESMSYNFTVDTTQSDILLLKYAAVLQNPSGHGATEQPRFVFEILDQNNNLIDPLCGYANFISGNTTDGWNQTTYNGVTLFWKDWTSVGFDVSAYHGQSVKVRLTTYDCSQGAHFGYAYFTLDCNRKMITALSCGEMDEVTYSAPAGFNYSWYYTSSPNNILSNNRTVTVTPNGQNDMLCCHVSFSENASCGFNLYTSITSRYPLASFSPVRELCSTSFAMNNSSCVSADGINPLPTMESCETAHWDFGDSTTSDEYNPTHTYPAPGTYTVTLVSGLSNDACLDTATYTITFENPEATISGDFDICDGDTTLLYASGASTYQWYTNGVLFGTDSIAAVSPSTTTTYTLRAYTEDGCEMIKNQEVIVLPSQEYLVSDTMCYGETYNRYGFSLPQQTTAGVFTQTRTGVNLTGCDTNLVLTLTVKEPIQASENITIVQNSLPFTYNDSVYTAEGTYVQHLTSVMGCDSLLTVHLAVLPNTTNSVDTTVCASDLPFLWHGHSFVSAGSHTVVLTASNGVDSTVTYNLAVDSVGADIASVTHVVCYGASTGVATAAVVGGQTPMSYLWTNASGVNLSTALTVGNCPAGTYTFTATDHLGCTASTTATLNTLNGELVPGSITADQTICEGMNPEPFTGTEASGGDNGAYQWQMSSDGTNWGTAPGTANTQNYTYPNPVANTFQLRRAWVSQSCGTVYSNVVTVTVWYNSSDTIVAGVCLNETYAQHGFQITADQTSEVGEYTYEQHHDVTGHCDSAIILKLAVYPDYEVFLQDDACEGGGYTENGFAVSPQATVGVDSLNVTLNLQSAFGCDSVVHVHLTVIDTALRIVNLTADFCEDLSAELMVVTNMPDYEWSTGESVPTITVNSPGYYSVTAVQGGCQSTKRIRIEDCHYNLYLPNVITPSNGDGVNDFLSIPELNQRDMVMFEISIFNRWGEMIFYSTDKSFKWYGDYRDKTQYNTVYNYVIEYTDMSGRPYRLLGTITVL